MITTYLTSIHTENALGDIDDQPILSQPLEEQTQVTSVLLGVGAGNENIVDVHENELLKAATDFIHKSLERLCRILESKWHAQELKQAERRYDSGLWDVVGSHRDLVVPTHQVYFREYPFTF